jgi:hypothetical protein
MALRARANGQPLTMAGYLAFGEWQADGEETAQKSEVRGRDLVVRVQRCPWHRAWEEQELLPFGRLYCLDIDRALVQGFGPELRLEVGGTLTGGDECCEFVFFDIDQAPAASGRVVMPWEYHLGHLFKTMSEAFLEQLGEQGQAAADEALAAFAARHGHRAARVVAAHRHTDFDRLPEPTDSPITERDER